MRPGSRRQACLDVRLRNGRQSADVRDWPKPEVIAVRLQSCSCGKADLSSKRANPTLKSGSAAGIGDRPEGAASVLLGDPSDLAAGEPPAVKLKRVACRASNIRFPGEAGLP
jgi:hypothetical protein